MSPDVRRPGQTRLRVEKALDDFGASVNKDWQVAFAWAREQVLFLADEIDELRARATD